MCRYNKGAHKLRAPLLVTFDLSYYHQHFNCVLMIGET